MTQNHKPPLYENQPLSSRQPFLTNFVDAAGPKHFANLSFSDTEKRIRNLFKDAADTHDNYLEVFMGTVHGGFTIGSDLELPGGYDPRNRPWYKKALASPSRAIISKAYRSTTGDAVFSSAHSVSKEGKTVGVAALDVSLGGLTQLIKSIKRRTLPMVQHIYRQPEGNHR